MCFSCADAEEGLMTAARVHCCRGFSFIHDSPSTLPCARCQRMELTRPIRAVSTLRPCVSSSDDTVPTRAGSRDRCACRECACPCWCGQRDDTVRRDRLESYRDTPPDQSGD